MRVEQRQLRDTYSATTVYEAGAEVYDPASQDYYQALRDTTGNAPTVLSGTERITNLAYWAQVQREPDAADFITGVTYLQGQQARDPETGLTHQCHTGPTTNPPTTEANWGVVNAFAAYIPRVQTGKAEIGTVRQVTERNPREYAAAGEIQWNTGQYGIELPSRCVVRPWVEHRLRTPLIHGDIWSPTVSYTPENFETIDTAPPMPPNPLREFSTLADMLAADSRTFTFARVWNFLSTDGIESEWTKTGQSGLSDNGTDVRQGDDGAFFVRTWVKEPV